jgi:hypothetical protein
MAGRKPGTPKTGGRRKGTTNKVTALAKDAIAAAADRLGGVDRLVEWVRQDTNNERVFWGQIYTKLLPLQVAGDTKQPVQHIIVGWLPPTDR